MGDKSKIEWTDATWNPIRARLRVQGGPDLIGWHCEHVSEGCRNCDSESMNRRLGTGLDFKPGHRADVKIFLDEKMLLAPLRWKKPRRIFVNSMSDTFADFVKVEWLDRMFAVMALAPRHTFQVLTKRPERMREYFQDRPNCFTRCDEIDVAMNEVAPQHWCARELQDYGGLPLKNVWLGVSAEDQATADERIPLLLQTPAAMRFVSLEPLLLPIDLRRMTREGTNGAYIDCALTGFRSNGCGGAYGPKLDWVIVGGESGKGARPMHPAWARSLRDQCVAAGVPFFFKQFGEWAPHMPTAGGDLGGDCRADRVRIVHRIEHSNEELLERSFFSGDAWAKRVGKKAAGRLLDGREHNGMPGAP